MKRFLGLALSLGISCALGLGSKAVATETGGGIYPNGAESFLTAAVPPPGYYVIDYDNYYEAQHLLGNAGNDLIPAFRVDALANAFRFVHWSSQKFLGAQVGQQFILPYVVLDVSAAGLHQHKSGFGDLTVDPLLLSFQNAKFHVVVTPEINLPTGEFKKGDLANIGRNYFNFEPVVAFTYTGAKNFEFDSKLMYDINTVNPATNYTSGNEPYGLRGRLRPQRAVYRRRGILLPADDGRLRERAAGRKRRISWQRLFLRTRHPRFAREDAVSFQMGARGRRQEPYHRQQILDQTDPTRR